MSMFEINGKAALNQLTVGELIAELEKYPKDAELGYFAINSNVRGSRIWADDILGVEYCSDGITVAIIGTIR
ncbi:MAG: hypothetical protein WC346_13125 [Methanogenium sp.]